MFWVSPMQYVPPTASMENGLTPMFCERSNSGNKQEPAVCGSIHVSRPPAQKGVLYLSSIK